MSERDVAFIVAYSTKRTGDKGFRYNVSPEDLDDVLEQLRECTNIRYYAQPHGFYAWEAVNFINALEARTGTLEVFVVNDWGREAFSEYERQQNLRHITMANL